MGYVSSMDDASLLSSDGAYLGHATDHASNARMNRARVLR